MIRVIGLDLSLTATGIAHSDGSTETIKTRPADGDSRLLQIVRSINDGIEPNIIAVLEDLPTHAKAAGITGMVHGAVRAHLLSRGVPYALVPPATLKAYATGKGNADKAGMTLAAYKRFAREFSDDNQVDAWWLRAAGLDWIGEPLAVMPETQRARLTKARWPDGYRWDQPVEVR